MVRAKVENMEKTLRGMSISSEDYASVLCHKAVEIAKELNTNNEEMNKLKETKIPLLAGRICTIVQRKLLIEKIDEEERTNDINNSLNKIKIQLLKESQEFREVLVVHFKEMYPNTFSNKGQSSSVARVISGSTLNRNTTKNRVGLKQKLNLQLDNRFSWNAIFSAGLLMFILFFNLR